MLKLGNLKKLGKSKRFLIPAVVVVVICVVVGIVLGVRATAYSCNIADLKSNEKVDQSVITDIHRYDLTLNDTIALDIYFNASPSTDQIDQLELIGGRVYEDTCMKDPYTQSFYCLGRFTVNDICRLCAVNYVELVRSAEYQIKTQEG
jgi:hypothetical protein